MLDLFLNRVAVTQLVALALAVLATIGLGVPAGLDTAQIVGLVMMGAAVVTAIVRYGHPGQPAADAKSWWESRTIWVQVVSFAFGLLATLNLLPAGLEQGEVVTTILAIVAALSAALGRSPVALRA
jgi:hypothetical protein